MDKKNELRNPHRLNPITSLPIASLLITSLLITSAPITSLPITSRLTTSAPITSAPIASQKKSLFEKNRLLIVLTSVSKYLELLLFCNYFKRKFNNYISV